MKQDPYLAQESLPDFALWEKMSRSRSPYSFDLELTARCNNNCRHCYINLPAHDKEAEKKELSLSIIKRIVDEAVELGAVWCLLTGGEPLLREDFFDIFFYIKKKGLLVSVFTNATLISDEHIAFFTKYPPRDMEVTVYGVTEDTYERISGVPGSFNAFMRGLNLLLENNIRVRFKTMALRSNFPELADIASFCRARTKDYFRFDPFLHLRYDGNAHRNEGIISERLSPEEIAELERKDPERFQALQTKCRKMTDTASLQPRSDHIFHCAAGLGSFSVSYDGYFQLCPSLVHPESVYDLKKGTVVEAWEKFIPKVRGQRSHNEEFLRTCLKCSLKNLCMWCPANAHLETGRMDSPVPFYCTLAQSRHTMATGQ